MKFLQKNKYFQKKHGFSLIELLIAIFVFSMGAIAVYSLIQSSLTTAIRSKNQIIITNLAREQLELLKNQRDSNWLQNCYWASAASCESGKDIGSRELFFDQISSSNPKFFLIQNNFNNLDSDTGSILFTKLDNNPEEKFKNNKWEEVKETRYCLDNQGRYALCDSVSFKKKTPFYGYIKIKHLKSQTGDTTESVVTEEYQGTNFPMAIYVESVVYDTHRVISKHVVPTILTNWR